MCYRCIACGSVAPKGTPRKVHVVYKGDGNVAQELPVCEGCDSHLKSGVTLATLLQSQGRVKAVSPANGEGASLGEDPCQSPHSSSFNPTKLAHFNFKERRKKVY